MPSHILISLWDERQKIAKEENEEQKKQQDSGEGMPAEQQKYRNMTPSSAMGMAKSQMSSMGVKMPSGSTSRPPSMPHLPSSGSFKL